MLPFEQSFVPLSVEQGPVFFFIFYSCAQKEVVKRGENMRNGYSNYIRIHRIWLNNFAYRKMHVLMYTSETIRLGREATTFYKCLAYMLALKQGKQYPIVMAWLWCRLGFAILSSATWLVSSTCMWAQPDPRLCWRQGTCRWQSTISTHALSLWCLYVYLLSTTLVLYTVWWIISY